MTPCNSAVFGIVVMTFKRAEITFQSSPRWASLFGNFRYLINVPGYFLPCRKPIVRSNVFAGGHAVRLGGLPSPLLPLLSLFVGFPGLHFHYPINSHISDWTSAFLSGAIVWQIHKWSLFGKFRIAAVQKYSREVGSCGQIGGTSLDSPSPTFASLASVRWEGSRDCTLIFPFTAIFQTKPVYFCLVDLSGNLMYLLSEDRSLVGESHQCPTELILRWGLAHRSDRGS